MFQENKGKISNRQSFYIYVHIWLFSKISHHTYYLYFTHNEPGATNFDLRLVHILLRVRLIGLCFPWKMTMNHRLVQLRSRINWGLRAKVTFMIPIYIVDQKTCLWKQKYLEANINGKQGRVRQQQEKMLTWKWRRRRSIYLATKLCSCCSVWYIWWHRFFNMRNRFQGLRQMFIWSFLLHWSSDIFSFIIIKTNYIVI